MEFCWQGWRRKSSRNGLVTIVCRFIVQQYLVRILSYSLRKFQLKTIWRANSMIFWCRGIETVFYKLSFVLFGLCWTCTLVSVHLEYYLLSRILLHFSFYWSSLTHLNYLLISRLKYIYIYKKKKPSRNML